jgi:transposase InsO family protein
VIHRDIRPEIKELDIEAIVQYAKEQYPEARPRIISDNGPQFIANDFQSFVRLSCMTIERYHRTLKSDCIRTKCPLSLEEALVDRAKIRAQQAAARYAKRTRPEDRAMLGSNLRAESMPRASAMGVEASTVWRQVATG